MTPEFQARAALVRAHYIDAFLAAIADAGESEVVFEPVLRNSEGNAVGDGLLNLPSRVDMFNTADGQTQMVDSPGVLSLPELMMSVGGVEVRLQPFIWDYARVTVKHETSQFPTKELKGWFDEWFDVEEEEPLLDSGLSGCIHFMSDPETVGKQTRFTVDFGTAPEEALLSLIDCFKGTAECRVEVSSLTS